MILKNSVQHLFVRQAKHASCEHPIKPKLKPKPYPNRRCSDIDCLPIYYLLIIAVPDSSLLYIQLNKC